MLCISSTTAHASQNLLDSTSIRGFGTIGLVNGGSDTLGYKRDITRESVFSSSWSASQESLLGLQVDSQFNSQTSATIQLVARERPNNSIADSIEWLFLRHQLNDNWTVRLGRVGIDLYTLSDYRNVGFAYPWARPSHEFYGPIAFSYLDGGDITYATHIGRDYLKVKLFGGVAKQSLAANGSEELAVEPVFGLATELERDYWSFRVGLSSSTIASELSNTKSLADALRLIPSAVWPEAAEIANDVTTKNKRFNYLSFGVKYDNRPWLIESEFGYIDSLYQFFPAVANAYLSLGYQVQDVTYFGVISRAKNIEEVKRFAAPLNPPIPADPTNPIYALYQGVQSVADINGTDQTTFSLGLRWDIEDDLALKMQWDHHQVGYKGVHLWEVKNRSPQGDTLNTFTVNLSFIF